MKELISKIDGIQCLGGKKERESKWHYSEGNQVDRSGV